MKLSVLDQSPISEGMTGADALNNTLDLAKLADELGYVRYWVAEHHGTPMLASASPEALIGAIAAQTRHIRLGSGGVGGGAPPPPPPHPPRQRRRDAAALQPAQGGRDLQRSERPLPRAHRS